VSRRNRMLLGAALIPLLALAVGASLRAWPESVEASAEAHRAAAIYPDYAGVTIPPNIAPLNLKALESGRKFLLRLSGGAGAVVEVFSADGVMRIPAGPWRALLQANRGADLRMDIYAKGGNGWTHFDTVRSRVAAEEIDPYVVYRYIPPIYNKWDQISLRQRDLRNFDERVLFDTVRSADPEGKNVAGACINCHTFLNHRGEQMLAHVRPGGKSQIPAMILARGGSAGKIDTRNGAVPPAAYTSWRPDGKLLAFSRNSIVEMFQTAGVETRVVVDKDSDLGFYEVETGRVFTVPQLSRPDRLETFPSWSPDGRYLYFTAAQAPEPDKQKIPLHFDKIQYDLQRISHDSQTGEWGQVETVVSAAGLGKSMSLPLVSPDGRYLMFCGHNYGSFPIFQPSSDLYLVDLSQMEPTSRGGSKPLAAGKAAPRRLDEINSARADSYHTWSSNSRWVVFSSKREDGMFARPYIAYLEPGGHFGKPFVMPQSDPDFYARCLMTFNRPELLAEPVTVSATELARAINSTARHASGTPAAPAAPARKPDEPWQH
jgi:hypothetical protein